MRTRRLTAVASQNAGECIRSQSSSELCPAGRYSSLSASAVRTNVCPLACATKCVCFAFRFMLLKSSMSPSLSSAASSGGAADEGRVGEEPCGLALALGPGTVPVGEGWLDRSPE